MRPQRNAAENTRGYSFYKTSIQASMRPQRNAAENAERQRQLTEEERRFNEAAA